MFRRLRDCAIPGYAPICLDTNDPETVACGFRQRLLRKVPSHDKVKLKRLESFVRDWLKDNIPVVEPLSFEDWLASTTYTEERKNELRQVYELNHGAVPTKKECEKVDAFVKSEFYPTYKHARLINSRCDAFKVFSGPRFKAIENAVYALPQFIKHVPVPERPAKIRALRMAGRRYFQTDFTAYESHFLAPIMRALELQLYAHCLKNDVHAGFLCSVISGKNKMTTKAGVRAKVKARRMSGDMCTSLGNGFSNLMLALFLAHEKGGVLDGFVEGDDGLFCSDVELTAADYESLGFTIKIEEVDDPCQASFCGMIFSDSGEIIREPRRFFMGFGWTQSFIGAGDRIMDELLRAKALSVVYETPQCPIIGAMARRALIKTQGVAPRFVNDGYHVPHDVKNIPAFAPSSDTRLLFETMYGVSVSVQLQAEAAVARGAFEEVACLIPPTSEQLDYASKFVEVT